jgi:DDE family transposase
MYPLDEILLLCLLAVLAGAEAFTDIARFGEKKLDLLRRFRPYRDGTPAHDHMGDIFATLDAQALPRLNEYLWRGAAIGGMVQLRKSFKRLKQTYGQVRG